MELINEFGFKETGPNEEAEEMAVMVFNEVIDSNVESYWQSDRYKAILKKKSKNKDITELQDSALIDLYQKIETDFKQEIVTWKEIPSNVTFKFDLRGINPSRKLLYLLNKEGKECASTTLTYSGGETVTNINELKERIVKISKTAYYKPASSYKKHVKGTSNEQRSQNSENGGAGQYFYELSDNDISELERLALQNSTIQQYRERKGTPTVNDNQYYFLHSCSDDVGFVNGDETNQISVEITFANTKQEIHSHPR